MGKRLQRCLLPQCLLAPFPEPSHCQRPYTSSKDAGGKNLLPPPQDSPDGAWATSAARESGDFHLQDPSRGLPRCFQHSHLWGENPPLTPNDCRGFEGRTAEYLPAGATTREVEKRVGAGWGQGKIGRDVRSAPDVIGTRDGRGLASSALGSAGSARLRETRSLRFQHAGQRPRRHRLIKRSPLSHVGIAPPH